MNTIIFQAFRAATVLGIALFAFAGDVFAAPNLVPATVTRVSEHSATLSGHVSNPYKSTAVWFEVINSSGASTAVGAQPPLYDGGSGVAFEYTLDNLAQGQTYSYRSAAMEGGVTVYSPTSTFTTAVPKVVTPVASTPSSNTTTNPAPATKTTQPTAAQKAAATTTPVVSEGFTNGNSAAIIGVGNGMLPTTLIGWILLLIVTLIAVLVGHAIVDGAEKRKIEREKKKKLEEEEEAENE